MLQKVRAAQLSLAGPIENGITHPLATDEEKLFCSSSSIFCIFCPISVLWRTIGHATLAATGWQYLENWYKFK